MQYQYAQQQEDAQAPQAPEHPKANPEPQWDAATPDVPQNPVTVRMDFDC